MKLNENALYKHEEYGKVQITVIDARSVFFESVTETILTDDWAIPKTYKESHEEFKDSAEPADMVISASPETIGLEEVNL